jgi:DNA polymerase-3 subunit delta'
MWRSLNGSDRLGFDSIIGHNAAKKVLAQSVRQGMPSHALIIAGLKSVGKLTLAMEYSKALSCEDQIDGNACDKCAVCRAIEHGNFPDIRVYPPDKMNTTSINSMREMRDISSFRPMRGKWKINIIEQADTLNEESANCILKLLEEPPDYVINILLYRNEAAALSTIRSRCRMLRVFQVPAVELIDRLIEDFNADQEHAEFLASYTQGCPGLAISLLNDTQFQKDRDAIAQIASDVPKIGARAYLRLAENLRTGGVSGDSSDDSDDQDSEDAPTKKKAKPSARNSVMASMDTLLIWYRDLLAAKLQGEEASLVNSDRRQEIVRQASLYPNAESLQVILKSILSTRRSILGNANAQIQTEALLAKMALAAKR